MNINSLYQPNNKNPILYIIREAKIFHDLLLPLYVTTKNMFIR